MFLHQSAVTAAMALAPVETQEAVSGLLQQIIAAASAIGAKVPWVKVAPIIFALAIGGFSQEAWGVALPQLQAILADLLKV